MGKDRTQYSCSNLTQLYLNYYDDFDYKKQILEKILLTMNYISNVKNNSKVLSSYAQKAGALENSEETALVEKFKMQITKTLTLREFYEQELKVKTDKHILWQKVFNKFSKNCILSDKPAHYTSFYSANTAFQLSCSPNFVDRILQDMANLNLTSIKSIEFLSYDSVVSFELQNLRNLYHGHVGRQLSINYSDKVANEEIFKKECINVDNFIFFKTSFVQKLYK